MNTPPTSRVTINVMNHLKTLVILALAIGAFFAIPKAEAGGYVNLSFNTGGSYCAPPVTYYRRPPVYVRPAPVYYRRPAPVYYRRGPSCYRGGGYKV
ncbi:MAG: hypothetical protein WA771_05285, partial [Chthoniobacterales bacterium]